MDLVLSEHNTCHIHPFTQTFIHSWQRCHLPVGSSSRSHTCTDGCAFRNNLGFSIFQEHDDTLTAEEPPEPLNGPRQTGWWFNPVAFRLMYLPHPLVVWFIHPITMLRSRRSELILKTRHTLPVSNPSWGNLHKCHLLAKINNLAPLFMHPSRHLIGKTTSRNLLSVELIRRLFLLQTAVHFFFFLM